MIVGDFYSGAVLLRSLLGFKYVLTVSLLRASSPSQQCGRHVLEASRTILGKFVYQRLPVVGI